MSFVHVTRPVKLTVVMARVEPQRHTVYLKLKAVPAMVGFDMCLPELIDIGISKSTLRWRDTKINDIHDFTLHCYFREKTVPSGCFCR